MTDYKTSKGISKSYGDRDDKFKRASKHFVSEKERSLSKDLESDLVIQKYSQYTKTFAAPIQAIEPSSFAYFGKAEQYYNDSLYSIINYYPFDGTHEETLDWFISASNLDTSLLQQEWPTSVGHLDFNESEYVSFYAGPRSISQETYKGKVKNEESALRIDSDKGTTVEFWMKKNDTEDVETIFEIGTHPTVATTNTDEGRFRLKLNTTAEVNDQDQRTSFQLTYISASENNGVVSQIGVQDMDIGKSSGVDTEEAGVLTTLRFPSNNNQNTGILIPSDSDLHFVDQFITSIPDNRAQALAGNLPGGTPRRMQKRKDVDFCISFWINMTNPQDNRYQGILAKGSRNQADFEYALHWSLVNRDGGINQLQNSTGFVFEVMQNVLHHTGDSLIDGVSERVKVPLRFESPLSENGESILENEAGNWVHIAIVYKKTTEAQHTLYESESRVLFYKNGQPWGTDLAPAISTAIHSLHDLNTDFYVGMVPNTKPLIIGNDSTNAGIVRRNQIDHLAREHNFVGMLRDLLFIKHQPTGMNTQGALTDENVLEMYNSGEPMGDYNQLSFILEDNGIDISGYWKLNGPVVEDSSGRGNDGPDISDQLIVETSSGITRSFAASQNDKGWHHYALKVWQTETEGAETYTLNTKFYVDGALQTTNSQDIGATKINLADNAMSGRIGLSLDAANPASGTPLKSSIDNFRFWKGLRTSREIARYFDQKVYASDHSEESYVSRLGLNYTFNEATIGDSSRDKLVIDYSGNDVIGTINNYSNTCRVSTSAIDLSTSSTNTEIKEPILFEAHEDVKSLRTRLSEIGQSYDIQNSNTLNRMLPGWLFSEMYRIGNTDEMNTLLHMMATVFDEIMVNLGSLRKLTRPEYSNSKSSFITSDAQNAFKSTLESLSEIESGKVFNTFSYENKIDFMERLLENYGFQKSQYKFLWHLRTEDVVESIVENIRLERSASEIRSVLYDCLANAAAYAIKRKGAESSYNSILNAIGLGRDVISFNVIGQNAEIRLDKQSTDNVVKKLKSISFKDNYFANLHQLASSLEERSYLQGGSSNPGEDESEYTFEGNFIFPARGEDNFFITDSSIFGVYEVDGQNNEYSFTRPTNAGFQISVAKSNSLSPDAKFKLSSWHPDGESPFLQTQQTDSIKGVYDGGVWNISIRIYKDTSIGNSDNSTTAEYKLDFSGYNFILDELRRSFKKTIDLTQQQYESFKSANKTVFIGADREDITGELIKSTDIKVLSFNSWTKALTEEELKKRASHLTTYGIEDSFLYPNTPAGTVHRNPEYLSSLVLKMQLGDYSSEKLENMQRIKDETGGSGDLRAFFGDIRGYSYPMVPNGFTSNYDNAITIEHLPALQTVPISNVHGLDAISVKNSDVDYQEKDSKPELKILSFEKSMYRVISNEIFDFLSGTKSFNNLIGEPVNKYRQKYKFMDYLKRSFFTGVQNESQLDRFITYYRWLDKSIGHFLSFLIPGSSVANIGIENVVESHILERNKIQYKLPKLEFKEPEALDANVLGIEASDNPRSADAAAMPAEAFGAEEEREENQSSSRSAFTSAVTGRGSSFGSRSSNYSRYAQRSAYRTYRATAELGNVLSLGVNTNGNSITNYFGTVNSGNTITISSNNVKDSKETYKTVDNNKKKRFEVWAESSTSDEYSTGPGDLLLPITFYKSETVSDFPDFKTGLIVSSRINSNNAVQGMFGSRVNITQPHRNVPIGTSAEDRPEAYKITVNSSEMVISQPTGLASVFHKNSQREIFYNISNIKHDPANGVSGNYSKTREILLTTGRTANNRHLVKTSDETLNQEFTKSVQIPQLVDTSASGRTKQEHIIVSVFNGSMSPELGADYGKDSDALEYSVYNGMNNKNSMLREVLNDISRTPADQFGYASGSSTVASWHKVNRNTKYYHNVSSLDPVKDNFFVQNHIPQSDFGYNWIKKSAHSSLEDFLRQNMNMGHQHNFELPGGGTSDSLIQFVSSSVQDSQVDFVGLNVRNEKTFNDTYDTITNSSDSLNTILLNLNGPSGWNTWKQTRVGQNPLARKQNRENIYSIVFEGDSPFASPKPGSKFDYNRTVETNAEHTSARTTRSYSEIPVSKRFYPISYSVQPVEDLEMVNLLSYREKGYSSQEISSIFWSVDWRPTEVELHDIGMTKIVVKLDVQNDSSFFANDKMVEEVNFFSKPILQSKQLNTLNVFIRESEKSEISYGSTPQLNYIEKVYPREINTFTKKSRVRTRFNFFGWSNNRNNRTINMSGNISYGDFAFSNVNLAPSITSVTSEEGFNKSYFNKYDLVDINNFNNSVDLSSSTHLTQSTWVLDSRIDFSSLPLEISDSYFNNTASFMSSRDQGTRGAGILQNDFSLIPLGINAAFGAPPIAPVYNRRVIQTFGTSSFLAGEAEWQASSGHSVGPFYENYEDYSEKTRIIGREYSLVPEFTISKHADSLLTTSDIEATITGISDFLHLTGTQHPSSSSDLTTSTEFFKNYSNSDFLKYFVEIQENNIRNKFNLNTDKITMRSRAVKKLLPYRGFYPAERVVQISEIFDEHYLPTSAYSASFFASTDFVSSQEEAEELIKIRIQNSKSQVIRPLMAPGVLMNSIKAGLAVDYPIFSSSIDSAVDAIIDATEDDDLSMFSDLSLLPTGSDLCFTGSGLNSSQDTGIPRIKGSVSRRVTFRDLLNPERMYGEVVYDNEPHPSSSLLYGSKYHVALVERPASFGHLNSEKTKAETGAEFESKQISFAEKIMPYKSAMHNFTAETVNFFLEDGKLTTLMSDAVYPELTQDKKYKMYVYLENTGISMYDRHSAFGPAVDDGNAAITSYDFQTTIISGSGATGSIDFSAYNESISDSELASSNIYFWTDSTETTFEKVYVFDNSGGTDKQTGMIPSSMLYGGSNDYIYVQIQNLNTLTDVVDQFLIALTGTTGHYTNVSASYDSSSKLVTITRAATGSSTVVMSGSGGFSDGSPDPVFLGFGGGSTQSATTSSFLATTTSTSSGSHGYLPYVPPYLDPNTSPYAEITFIPPETDYYTIPQIIDGSTIVYHNLPSVSSATGTNYANSMNIEASLDLRNYVALKSDNYTYESSGDSVVSTKKSQTLYRWVVSTKWETPILDFTGVPVNALNLDSQVVEQASHSPWKKRYQNKYYEETTDFTVSYLTASTGMWHQKGELLPVDETSGYVLGISGPYVRSAADEVQNLAEILGFAPKDSKSSPKAASITYGNKRLGKVAKKKDICEAVVAIPYYENSSGEMQLFEINDLELDRAKNLNRRQTNKYYFDYTNASTAEKKLKLEEYYNWTDESGMSNTSNCAYQLRMMDKYVIPPSFDFTRNENVNPHVQYIFQFKSTLTQQDLADLWQNLYPESSNGPGSSQHSRISQNKADILQNLKQSSMDKEFSASSLRTGTTSFFKNPEIFNNEKVRWLVFKCKFRAVKDYSEIIKKSISPFKQDIMVISNSDKTPNSKTFTDYGYNWPYDYFSLVELADLSAKVDFSRESIVETEEDGTIAGIEVVASQSDNESDSESAAETTSFVNKNFINVESSSSSQMTFRQTLKSELDPAPSPANQMTITLPDGHSIKPGSESIYLNGVLQMQGSANDYTITSGVISFNYDIDSSDGVIVSYVLIGDE